MDKIKEDKMMHLETDMVIKASKNNDRIIEFIASKEVVDRGGDIIKIKGMNLKNFKKNPVILWSHNHNDLPVGKAIKITKSGDELKIKVQFATPEEYGFADTVYKLIKGGYINAVSIGIIPDWESMEYPEGKKAKNISRILHKSELLEISIVPIPMNQDALKTEKILSKAVASGVIDKVELKDYKIEMKEYELSNKKEENKNEHFKKDNININSTEKKKSEVEVEDETIKLKARIEELEFQLKEQKMEEELEDSIYGKLYDEFSVIKKDKDKDKDFNILDEYI